MIEPYGRSRDFFYLPYSFRSYLPPGRGVKNRHWAEQSLKLTKLGTVVDSSLPHRVTHPFVSFIFRSILVLPFL